MNKVIEAINHHGVLLVFPMNNNKEPHSLWSVLHPKSEMRWDWDTTGDNRVVKLWQLKTELSTTKKVVYSKWYKNRATYFSLELFTACLRIEMDHKLKLSRDSQNLLDTLITDSPLSTRQLKELTKLKGKMFESLFNKSMRPLWDHFQIVAYGEFEDSSFPSLGIGATQTLYEELIKKASTLNRAEALKLISLKMPEGSLFRKYWDKLY